MLAPEQVRRSNVHPYGSAAIAADEREPHRRPGLSADGEPIAGTKRVALQLHEAGHGDGLAGASRRPISRAGDLESIRTPAVLAKRLLESVWVARNRSDDDPDPRFAGCRPFVHCSGLRTNNAISRARAVRAGA
jgi:hypothetical protein